MILPKPYRPHLWAYNAGLMREYNAQTIVDVV